MKPTYVNNIPLIHGEVTVILSDSVTDAARHSVQFAGEVQRTGVNALVLNASMSDQRFRHIADPIIDLKTKANGYKRTAETGVETCLEIRSVVSGNLVREMEHIRHLCFECRIGVVIINSWEWSSSSWRRKNDLIFALRELMAEIGVAVFVYSTTTTKPQVGKTDRGGIGKLAELAMFIVSLKESDELKERVTKPKPIVLTPETQRVMARNAQLVKDKLKSYGESSQKLKVKSQKQEEVTTSNG